MKKLVFTFAVMLLSMVAYAQPTVYFLGASNNNSDPLSIHRHNRGTNKSDFRVQIGDDPYAGGSVDRFVVGVVAHDTGNWYERLVVQSNGNVGVGTSFPGYRFHVVGTSRFQGSMTITGSLSSSSFSTGGLSSNSLSTGSINATGTFISTRDILLKGGEYQSNGPITFHPDTDNTGDDVIQFMNNSDEEIMRIHSNGGVGIGITVPTAPLHVVGITKLDGALIMTGNIASTGNITTQQLSGTNLSLSGNIDTGGNINTAGSVGIGLEANKDLSQFADYKLAVNGKVRAKGVEVNAAGWADFVFQEDYQLSDLTEVEAYILENKHLPDVPSEKEVTEKGINLAEMDAILLQKIEELTLYVIDLKKENEAIKQENAAIKKRFKKWNKTQK